MVDMVKEPFDVSIYNIADFPITYPLIYLFYRFVTTSVRSESIHTV